MIIVLPNHDMHTHCMSSIPKRNTRKRIGCSATTGHINSMISHINQTNDECVNQSTIEHRKHQSTQYESHMISAAIQSTSRLILCYFFASVIGARSTLGCRSPQISTANLRLLLLQLLVDGGAANEKQQISLNRGIAMNTAIVNCSLSRRPGMDLKDG